jgi:hypothetical protein
VNAELRRNLWLELTLHRLIAAPVAIALMLLLAGIIGDTEPSRYIMATAAGVYAVVAAVWGALLAGEAVSSEQRGHTWDAQRMSAIEPWAMTWGKLAGVPAFAWYVGAICIPVFLYTAPRNVPAVRIAALMIAVTVLLHAIALIASISIARKGATRATSSSWVLGLVLFLVLPWLSKLSEFEEELHWWSMDFERLDFMLGTAVVFAAWAVYGAYRLMCQELQVRTTPWAWVAFLLFLAAYIAGLVIEPEDRWVKAGSMFLVAGLMVSLAATYLLLFTESCGAMLIRRVLLRIAARDWHRALQEAPCWPVTLALGLVFCVLTVLFAGARVPENEIFRTAVLAPIPLFLLVLRDAALYTFFILARQPRRADAATLFYLLLLYGLLPTLLRAIDATALADFVLPAFWERPGQASAVAAVQAGIVVALALWRWRKYYGN